MLENAPVSASRTAGDDRFSWLLLLRTLKIALGVPLVLGTLGGIATTAGWSVVGRACLTAEARQSPNLQTLSRRLERWPADRTFLPPWERLPAALGPPPADPITTVPCLFVGPLLGLLNPGGSWSGWAYFGLGFFWSLLVWAFFGGAITRMAVLRLSWDQRLELIPALSFAHRRLGAHLGAMLAPLLAIVTLAIPVIGLAVLMKTSLGAAVGGVLWFGVTGVALCGGVLALGLGIGWPLIWGTLAAEDSDAFDAMSRAYAYAFQGAARYAGYLVVTIGVGLVGWGVVWAFSELVLSLADWMAVLGMGRQRLEQLTVASDSAANGLDRFASHAIFFWTAIVRSIASGFAYAYFWTAFAGIYLLLRRDVESTPLDEISGLHDDEEMPDLAV